MSVQRILAHNRSILGWVLLLLVFEAAALRLGRWFAIETAIPLNHPKISTLVAHRDVVRAVLFSVLALCLVVAKGAIDPLAREELRGYRPRHWLWLINVAFFFLLSTLLYVVPSRGLVVLLERIPEIFAACYALLAISWMGVVVTALFLALPPLWLLTTIRCNLAGLTMLFTATAVYVTVQPHLASFEILWSGALLAPTVYIATRFARMLGIESITHPQTSYFGTSDFTVDIGPTCLGYQGVSIVLIVLLAYCVLHRRQLKFPNALSVLPVSIGVLLILNALRIATLVAIGSYWSPEVAVIGFHSTAGWVELILTIAAALIALNRFGFFAYQEKHGESCPEQEAYLFPLFASIGTSFLTQLFSGAFDWAYPVHILVTVLVLWIYWSRYPVLHVHNPAIPMVAGFAVFAIWIVLVPTNSEDEILFNNTLFSAPAWLVFFWLLLRMLGAILVVPLAEEFAFRAFFLRFLERYLSNTLGPRVATMASLLLSSLAFGLMHEKWLAGILAGAIYGTIYLRQGRIYDAVLAHVTTNLLLSVYVMLFEQWSFW